MNRKPAWIAIAVAATVVMIAATVRVLFSDRSLTRLQDNGVIKVGYAVEAPYAFLKPGGVVTGESPEVAKWIVARLGIESIDWRQMDFDELIPSLEADRIDVIAAGMFITWERAAHVSFSEPTFHVRQALLVGRGNPHDLHSYEQAAARSDVKMAVLSGSVEDWLLRSIGFPDHRLVIVPDALTGRVMVETGAADGLALSSPTVRWMVMRDLLGKTDAAEPFQEPATELTARLGYGGFAFRKRDRQLLAVWNTALKSFVGSKEHLMLISQFGFAVTELPGAVTTREILAR